MLACAVSSLYSAVSWGTDAEQLPDLAPRAPGFDLHPEDRDVPEVGGMRPLIMLIVVVFPEPLGPSSPST